ncbi:uncharacterized protein TNCV_4178691 [Trichonephila clavipes]|nr:uncharacterized protein TNCV_4178691 [Trichonephila clavipes]
MAVLFVDVAIQPEVHFIAKQNSLMKIGNNGSLVLGPFDESTPCLIIFKICDAKILQLKTMPSNILNTKFIHPKEIERLCATTQDVIVTVTDISSYTYDIKQDKILQYFSQSDASRLNLLLHDLQLGDKRPSHLLSEMGNLAPSKLEDDLLQTLWLQRLPANLQQILSVCKASLDDLTQISDKVHEVSGNDLTVARIETKSNQIELDVLKAEMMSRFEEYG